MRHQLEAYHIRVYKQGHALQDPLDAKMTGLPNLRELLASYFEVKGEGVYTASRESKSALKIEKFVDNHETEMWGQISSGDFGYQSALVNLADGSTKYKRKVDDVELVPLYFRVKISATLKEGVLVVQKFGARSVATPLKKELESHAKTLSERLRFLCNPLEPKEYIKSLLGQQQVSAVTLIRRELPRDLCDTLALTNTGGYRTREGVFQLTLRAPRNHFFAINRQVAEWVDALASDRISPFVELSNGDDYDDAKIEIGSGVTKRTLTISNISKFRTYRDLLVDTDEKTGFPTLESVDAEGQKYMKELADSLWEESSQ